MTAPQEKLSWALDVLGPEQVYEDGELQTEEEILANAERLYDRYHAALGR